MSQIPSDFDQAVDSIINQQTPPAPKAGGSSVIPDIQARAFVLPNGFDEATTGAIGLLNEFDVMEQPKDAAGLRDALIRENTQKAQGGAVVNPLAQQVADRKTALESMHPAAREADVHNRELNPWESAEVEGRELSALERNQMEVSEPKFVDIWNQDTVAKVERESKLHKDAASYIASRHQLTPEELQSSDDRRAIGARLQLRRHTDRLNDWMQAAIQNEPEHPNVTAQLNAMSPEATSEQIEAGKIAAADDARMLTELRLQSANFPRVEPELPDVPEIYDFTSEIQRLKTEFEGRNEVIETGRKNAKERLQKSIIKNRQVAADRIYKLVDQKIEDYVYGLHGFSGEIKRDWLPQDRRHIIPFNQIQKQADAIRLAMDLPLRYRMFDDEQLQQLRGYVPAKDGALEVSDVSDEEVDRGYLEELHMSLKRGAINVLSGAYETAAAYMPGMPESEREALRLKVQHWNELAQTQFSKSTRLRHGVFGQKGQGFNAKMLLDPGYYMSLLGEQGPQLLMISKAAKGGGVGGLARASALGFSLEAGNYIGEVRERLIERGMPADEAQHFAKMEGAVYGIMAGLLEYAPFARELKRNRSFGQAITQHLRRALAEGTTEGLQRTTQELLELVGHGGSGDMESAIRGILEEGLAGFIVMGSIPTFTNANTKAQREQQKVGRALFAELREIPGLENINRKTMGELTALSDQMRATAQQHGGDPDVHPLPNAAADLPTDPDLLGWQIHGDALVGDKKLAEMGRDVLAYLNPEQVWAVAPVNDVWAIVTPPAMIAEAANLPGVRMADVSQAASVMAHQLAHTQESPEAASKGEGGQTLQTPVEGENVSRGESLVGSEPDLSSSVSADEIQAAEAVIAEQGAATQSKQPTAEKPASQTRKPGLVPTVETALKPDTQDVGVLTENPDTQDVVVIVAPRGPKRAASGQSYIVQWGGGESYFQYKDHAIQYAEHRRAVGDFEGLVVGFLPEGARYQDDVKAMRQLRGDTDEDVAEGLDPRIPVPQVTFTKDRLRKIVDDEFPELAIGSRAITDTLGMSEAERTESRIETMEIQEPDRDYARLIATTFIMDKNGELHRELIGKLVGLKTEQLVEGDTWELDGRLAEVVSISDEGVAIELHGEVEGQPSEMFFVAFGEVVPSNVNTFDGDPKADRSRKFEDPTNEASDELTADPNEVKMIESIDLAVAEATEGLPGAQSTVGSDIRDTIYRALGLPKSGDVLYRLGILKMRKRPAFNGHDEQLIQDVARNIATAEAESRGLDIDGLLGPSSSLTEKGKRELMEDSTERASDVLKDIQDRLEVLFRNNADAKKKPKRERPGQQLGLKPKFDGPITGAQKKMFETEEPTSQAKKDDEAFRAKQTAKDSETEEMFGDDAPALYLEWQKLKKQYPDTVLLIKGEDGQYAIIGDDAWTVKKLIGGVVVESDGTKNDAAMMILPEKGIEVKLRRLIAAGQRVAVIDQKETAKQAGEEEHEFSSTQLDLPSDLSESIHAWGVEQIDDSELTGDGRQDVDDMHVTVLYGLEAQTPDRVDELARGSGPVELTLGKTSIFTTEDADVVKVEIEVAPQLKKLRETLEANTKNTQTFPDYKPHITIAYVKKGEGKKYAGSDAFAGQKVTISALQFSDKTRNKTAINLEQSSEVTVGDDQRPGTPAATPGKTMVVASNQKEGLAKIIVRLFTQLNLKQEIMDNDDYHVVIENSPYIDLVIERHGEMVYLTHYLEQNGDKFIDAEMVFKLEGDGNLSFVETATQNPIHGGESRRPDARFARIFANNLIEQGFGEGTIKRDNEQRAEAPTAESARVVGGDKEVESPPVAFDPSATPAFDPDIPAWQQTLKQYMNRPEDAWSKRDPANDKSIAKIGHVQQVKRAVMAGEKVPVDVLEAYRNNPWAAKAIEAQEGGGPAFAVGDQVFVETSDGVTRNAEVNRVPKTGRLVGVVMEDGMRRTFDKERLKKRDAPQGSASRRGEGEFTDKDTSLSTARQPLPGQTSPPPADHPLIQLSDWVEEKIDSGEKFTTRAMLAALKQQSGQSAAGGDVSIKDAYDAMELAINRYILKTVTDPADMAQVVDAMEAVLAIIPTQTTRSEEADQFQQFSTPPHYSAAIAWLANIGEGDRVLEPSAGVGGIATWASLYNPAALDVNELANRRALLLASLLNQPVFRENAEQLNNALPDSVKPTVVVMNPPFSQTAGRKKTKDLLAGARHITQALERLEPGGRLVAIVGEGMAFKSPTYKGWWDGTAADHNIMVNVEVDGQVYKKFGTTFGTRVLVIDKPVLGENPTIGVDKALTGKVQSVSELVALVEDDRNARSPRPLSTTGQRSEQVSPESVGGEISDGGGRATRRTDDAPGSTAGVGAGPSAVETGVPSTDLSGDRPVSGSRSGGRATDIPRRDDTDDIASDVDRSVEDPAARRDKAEDAGDVVDKQGRAEPQRKPSRVAAVSEADQRKATGKEEAGSLFNAYLPTVAVTGAKPHPSPLVESAAMASVTAPANVTYEPDLPEKTITEGKLSDAQLEAVVRAGQAHSKVLPNGQRRGFMIGDGTGVGKGREAAGIILDNQRQGRKRSLWVSYSGKGQLLDQAVGDMKDIGGDANDVFLLNDFKDNAEIDRDGVAFTSFKTVGEGFKLNSVDAPRFKQIVEWLGADFDGVIIFDEAHRMSNSMETKEEGEMYAKKAAAMAMAGVELQKALPNARVVYATGTGAVDVADLGYAERLGLWGEGTAFDNKEDFVNKISEGGLAAMELVARDMKQLGLYVARSLSMGTDPRWKGRVEFEQLVHDLTPEQIAIYDKLAEAWQVIQSNVEEALKETASDDKGRIDGRAKASARSRLWSANQRFWNQVLIAMQMPSTLKQMEADLAAGHSIVVQLVNHQGEQLKKALTSRQPGEDLADIDLTPRQAIMQYVARSFPVTQYEEFTDDEGRKRMQVAKDAAGNPLQNRKAIQMRERLLDELSTIKVPLGALDQILDHFGAENVSEVTGRERRVVNRKVDGVTKRVEERRNPRHRSVDIAAFNQNKRRILVFSMAGGTGASYHASRMIKNQARRVHYLVEPGWEAKAAVQGLGRTHRSNQTEAPLYRLVMTNVRGHKRFVSTIAKRLEQLGAITRGQRQTGTQGIFRPEDNLESQQAQDAMKLIADDLLMGRDFGGMDLAAFEQATGLQLRNNKNEPKPPPTIQQFLNRVLSMKVADQNTFFEAFEKKLAEVVARAEAEGFIDVGLEEITADKVVKASEQVVHTDGESGAQTKYVEIVTSTKTSPFSFKRVLNAMRGDREAFFIRNKKSGRVWMVRDTGMNVTDRETGAVHLEFQRFGVQGATNTINSNEIADSTKFERVKRELAEELWTKEIENLPPFKEKRVHLITGAVLPVWDKLKGGNRVFRVTTDAGEQLLGRVIPDRHVADTLRSLGQSVSFNVTPRDLVDDIMQNNHEVKLSNGWVLKRVTLQGEQRIEIIGPDFNTGPVLKDMGVLFERPQYKGRWFIPTGEPNDAAVMGKLLASPSRTIESIKTPDDDKPTIHGGRIPRLVAGSTAPNSQHRRHVDRSSEARTSGGRRLLAVFRRDPNGERVGIRTIVQHVLDLASTEMRLGRSQTTAAQPAHYVGDDFHIVRSRTAGWQLNFHEGGHGISAWIREGNDAFLDVLGNRLNMLTQRPDSFASEETPEEGFAEWVRLFIVAPASIPTEITSRLVNYLANNHEDLLNGLMDAQTAYAIHADRTIMAQLLSYQRDRDPGPSATKVAGELWHKTWFMLSRGTALQNRVYRRIFKNAHKVSTQTAQNLVDSMADSPADFRTAHQTSLHTPGEVHRAMTKPDSAKGLKGIRFVAYGNNALEHAMNNVEDEETVERFRELFDVPASSKHGQFVYLTDFAFRSIVDAIGKENWTEFEVYGWMRAALTRHDRQGHVYPGLTEGLTPGVLRGELRRLEAAHPNFRSEFDRVNHFMDQLLLVPVASGEITVEDAVRIAEAWGETEGSEGFESGYWPLPRVLEESYPGLAPEANRATGMDSGIRRAYGSDQPFRSLVDAVENRLRLALETFSENRIRLSVREATRVASNDTSLPLDVRAEIKRIMVDLGLDWKMMATLNEREMQETIAQYMDQQTATEMGVQLADLPATARVDPDTIHITFPGVSVWRQVPPNARRVIALWENGARKFYEIADPILYEYFANTTDPVALVKWYADLMQPITKTWKRGITHQWPFFIWNTFVRDPSTAMGFGKGKGSWIPGSFAFTGLLNRFLGTAWMRRLFPNGHVEIDAQMTEMLSTSGDALSTREHKNIVDRFVAVVAEGLYVPGWKDMSVGKQLTQIPGVMFATVMKPVDLFNWISGARAASQWGEAIAREGAFVKQVKSGASAEKAQAEYDFVTGNFIERPGGPNTRTLMRQAGFMNPSIQILTQMYMRVFDPDPRVRREFVALKIPLLFTLGMMSAAIKYLGLDDEDKEVMKERTLEDRLRYMWFKNPFDEGTYLRMPFDYGPLGAATSAGHNLMESWLLNDDIDGMELAKFVLGRSADVPALTDIGGPFIKTWLETKTNHSFFFDKAIVPPYMQEYPPELQAFRSTPGLMKWLGKKLDISPIKLDYAVRSVFTSQVRDGIATIGRFVDGAPPEQIAEMPFLGRLFGRKPDGWESKSVTTVADLDKQFQAQMQIYKALEKADPSDPRLPEMLSELESLNIFHKGMRGIRLAYLEAKRLREEGDTAGAIKHEEIMVELAREILKEAEQVDVDNVPSK